jgi:hypothetical protein
MIWPREVLNPALYLFIGVPGPFCAELKYAPIIIVAVSDE